MVKKKTTKKTSVPRTRNAGTLTESQYWGKIRSALRNAFRYWKPMTLALEKASRPSKSANKRIKKEYQCAECKEWFKRADVQIDHIIPCGSLRNFNDIPAFIENLTIENPKAYQILCKPHHLIKTKEEKLAKKLAQE